MSRFRSTVPHWRSTRYPTSNRSSTAYLQRITDELRSKGYEDKYVVQFGDPAMVISDMEGQLKSDAIIMSTHGRSGVSHWLFGSVTNKVLSMASCPVLVVPSTRRVRVIQPNAEAEAVG